MSYFPEYIPFMSKEELRKNGIRIPKDATDKNVGTTDARQAFMDIVYSELHSDGDNNRANRIIDAADEYAESAQLSKDCISRQAAIDALKTDMASLDQIIKGMSANDVRLDAYVSQRNQVNYDIYTINNLPPAQPETTTVTIGRTMGGITMWYKCDACDEPVDQNDNYCRNCGRKLKHE